MSLAMPVGMPAGRPAERATLGVSLVLYRNDPSLIRDVLASVRATGGDLRVCVVDNSPTDSLRTVVEESECAYIHDPSNPGFGASHNRALRELPASEYHLVVNPDISFPPESMNALLDFLRAEPDVGLVTPRILFPNGEPQYLCKRYPSLFLLFARRFIPGRLQFLVKRWMDRYEMRDCGYDRIMEVPYASGCFMLFRRAVLDRIGGFDDRFFLYMEDADISVRVAKDGFRVLYYPGAHVFHHWQRGSHKSLKLTWTSIRSSLYFFSKHGWKLF